jgi:hypothetical protein
MVRLTASSGHPTLTATTLHVLSPASWTFTTVLTACEQCCQVAGFTLSGRTLEQQFNSAASVNGLVLGGTTRTEGRRILYYPPIPTPPLFVATTPALSGDRCTARQLDSHGGSHRRYPGPVESTRYADAPPADWVSASMSTIHTASPVSLASPRAPVGLSSCAVADLR